MKYNLNHSVLSLADIANGKTQRIDIKVGRRNLKMDIDKNALDAFISVYYIGGKVKSKYDPGAALKTITVKKDAVITKDIIENIAEIETAQRITREYKKALA